MTIKEMQDKVIRAWGFEHPATIYFFRKCERTNDLAILEVACDFALKWIDLDGDAEQVPPFIAAGLGFIAVSER